MAGAKRKAKKEDNKAFEPVLYSAADKLSGINLIFGDTDF
jgi:hypothetical protein